MVEFQCKTGATVNVRPVVRSGITNYVVETGGKKEYVSECDIRRVKDSLTGYGIVLSGDVARTFCEKGRVILTITAETYEDIQKEGRAFIEARIKEEMAKPISSWAWTLGGDTHMVRIFPEGGIYTEFREDVTEVQDILRNWIEADKVLREVSEVHPDQNILPNIYNVGPIYRITNDTLMQIINEYKMSREKAKQEKEKAEEEKYKMALSEAQRTGKPVVLRTWNAPCNDPREDCDIDDVYEYVFPDGSKKVERYHNW